MTTKNLLNVMLKNLPISLLAAMLPLSLAAQAFWVARALFLPSGAKLRPNLRGYWRGLAAAVQQAPTMLRKRRDVQRRRRITARELVALIRNSERQRSSVARRPSDNTGR